MSTKNNIGATMAPIYSGPVYVYVATHGSKVAHVKRADGFTVCGVRVTGRWRTIEQGKHGEAHDPKGYIAKLCGSCWRMRDADSMTLAKPGDQVIACGSQVGMLLTTEEEAGS